MKKNQKFWKGILLFLILCLCNVIPVFAAKTYTEGYFNYIIEEESITITYYKGSEVEVTVPNSLLGYPVSKLAAGSFINSTTLRKLNLPDTIVKIEEGALPQGITIVYDSNTEKAQSSGVSEETWKNDDETADSKEEIIDSKKETVKDSSEIYTETVPSKDTLDEEFSIEEVEIMDGMIPGQSSGIDIDALNAAVSEANTDKESASEEEKKAVSSKGDTVSEKAASSKETAVSKEDTSSEEKTSSKEETASKEDESVTSKEEGAASEISKETESKEADVAKAEETENDKEADTKEKEDAEEASDSESNSKTEAATEKNTGIVAVIVILIIAAASLGRRFFQKEK